MAILEVLFSSRVRAKVIGKLFMSPGESFNAHQLSAMLQESYNAVWKELHKLKNIGILSSFQQGNAKNFTVNSHCPIHSELNGMVLKTVGVGDFIRSELSGYPEIRCAFIYGSFASGEGDTLSDLDLLMIGKIDLQKLTSTIDHLERGLGRQVNYLFFSIDEWKAKINAQDAFMVNVLNSPIVMLIGEIDDL